MTKDSFTKGSSINHVTGGEGFWSKRHEKFLKSTKCDFEIFSFLFFNELPMNLVALVKDFQN